MTEPVAQATFHSHPCRIDTHHHILPPTYLAEERERILGTVTGDQSFLEWSPERSLEESLGSSLARLSLLDRRLARVVVETNRATLRKKVGRSIQILRCCAPCPDWVCPSRAFCFRGV